MLIGGLIYFCKNIFFFIILFTIFNLFHLHAETVIKLPEHHNQDGTFKNTNGFSNDRSFREMFKWNRERKNINVEPIQFPTKEPDFKIINDYLMLNAIYRTLLFLMIFSMIVSPSL